MDGVVFADVVADVAVVAIGDDNDTKPFVSVLSTLEALLLRPRERLLGRPLLWE